MHVDPRRDAGEHDEREQERPAAHDERAGGREQQTEDGEPAEQGAVPVWSEVDGEQDRSQRPAAETREPLEARGRDQQHRQPEAAEDSADLGGHGVTTTIAFATCPCSATRST